MKKLIVTVPKNDDLCHLKREVFENQACWSVIEMLGRQNPVPEELLEQYRKRFVEGQIAAEELRQNLLHDHKPEGAQVRRFQIDLSRDELILWTDAGEER